MSGQRSCPKQALPPRQPSYSSQNAQEENSHRIRDKCRQLFFSGKKKEKN